MNMALVLSFLILGTFTGHQEIELNGDLVCEYQYGAPETGGTTYKVAEGTCPQTTSLHLWIPLPERCAQLPEDVERPLVCELESYEIQ